MIYTSCCIGTTEQLCSGWEKSSPGRIAGGTPAKACAQQASSQVAESSVQISLSWHWVFETSLYQSQKPSLTDLPLWGLPDVQESEARLDAYMKYKTSRHLMCQKHFLERPKCSCARLRVQGGGGAGCLKKHLSWQAGYTLFISKGACKTLPGSIKCPMGQGWSCAGHVVQASRPSPMLFEEVEDPAPHELCFARLSLNKSEKCLSSTSCTEKASQGLAGVTVGQPCLFSFEKGLDRGMLSGGGGARNSSSGNWKGQHEAGSECILSAWGGWHGERLRMEKEEWDPWSLKEKQQETRFENRKIKLEGVGETRKVGEERRGGKAERQWGRQSDTERGWRKREEERENHIKGIKPSNWEEQGVQLNCRKEKC